MDLGVEEFVDGLLSEEAQKRPSDTVKVDDLALEMRLPEWFDEEKYNNGRRFFWNYCFAFGINIILGLVAVFAVPSILKILMGTRRSNSVYTSYMRYISTLMHVMSWHKYDLKPGTKAWRSLHTVRSRHLRAGLDSQLKGRGTISQRDMGLTLFGFFGFALLKPDHFSIRQDNKEDWEGFNHFWRTIGYMIGLEDRYNICRKNIDETREVCRLIKERVFTPCLENVPEYFEHLARVMLKGLGMLSAQIETNSILFSARHLADVPGYVYSESERIDFQKKLKEHLKGKSEDIGVDTAKLINKSAVEGLPKGPPRLLYLKDFDSIETTPAYRQLNFLARYKLASAKLVVTIYNTSVGRWLGNLLFRWNNFIVFNFPYKAFMLFGVRKSFVNMFAESPKDDEQPKLNAEYYKPLPPDTWYDKLLTILWLN
ncbi:uncharacterized protein [Epargyreus clarus]|uniref:uncharacterized protein n=1 Tax=Epargyreus clarus TaxID=520877 RepID=UPI003C2BDBE8